MQLMTKEIEQKIPALRTTENMDPSEIVGPMGLKIERDRGFQAKLSEVMT